MLHPFARGLKFVRFQTEGLHFMLCTLFMTGLIKKQQQQQQQQQQQIQLKLNAWDCASNSWFNF